MNLYEVADGGCARVVRLMSSDSERRRLTELGVRHGAVVQVIRRAPFRGPIAIRVGGGLLALRPENAARVVVEELADG